MNLLDHYIIEVHSVSDIVEPFGDGQKYVKVDFTVNCYGAVERKTDIWPLSAWKEAESCGRYLA